LLLCLAAGCQPQLYARGAIEAPTPVIRADVRVEVSFFGVPLAGAQDIVFVLDPDSVALRTKLDKDMKIDAGSRYGLWLVVIGMLGTAVVTGLALKEKDDGTIL
jgi:hypothetical protein